MLFDCTRRNSKSHAERQSRQTPGNMLISLILIILFCGTSAASAQEFRRTPGNGHYPLSQRTPPGISGYWAGATGRADSPRPQPIRVVLPSKGTVTIYGNPTVRPLSQSAPAGFAVGVGYTYRLQISGMPEFPRARLFPSIEIIDRLHPPKGLANQFPIPIEFSREDIELALEGRFVTKVVYLEQPQLASPLTSPIPVQTVSPDRNAVAEADRRGRPVAIVRLGGRRLHPDRLTIGNFGRGGPMTLIPKPTVPKKKPAPK